MTDPKNEAMVHNASGVDEAGEAAAALLAASQKQRLEGVKKEVKKALDGLQRLKTFASHDALDDMDDPCIIVKDIGLIRLPLVEEQARQMIEKAQRVCSPPSPHSGQQQVAPEDTVNSAIAHQCNTYELDMSFCEIKHPQWQQYVDGLLDWVGEEMGVDVPMRADFSRMLIYQKGDPCKDHDFHSTKKEGVFATLAVCLPSVHEGGEVALNFDSVEKVVRTQPPMAEYMCWYSDVTAETRALKSGYRWTFMYELVVDGPAEGHFPTAQAVKKETESFRRSLENWGQATSETITDDPETQDQLFYPLGSKYSPASNPWKIKDQRDLEIIRLLQQACPELGYDMFLAVLEKEVNGTRNYQEDDCIDFTGDLDGQNRYDVIDKITKTKYRTDVRTHPSGKKLASHLDYSLSNVLGQDVFEDMEPSQQETHNSYFTRTHRYWQLAVLLIPTKNTFPLFFKHAKVSSKDLRVAENLLALVLDRFFLNPNGQSAWDNLKEFFAWIFEKSSDISRYRSYGRLDRTGLLTPQAISKILCAALLKGDLYLFDETTQFTSSNLLHMNLTDIRTSLNASMLSFGQVEAGLRRIFRSEQQIQVQLSAFQDFAPDFALSHEIREFVSTTTASYLNSITGSSLFSQDHGRDLVDLAYYCLDLEKRQAAIKRILRQNGGRAVVQLGFMARLLEKRCSMQVSHEEFIQVYSTIAAIFPSNLDLKTIKNAIDDSNTPVTEEASATASVLQGPAVREPSGPDSVSPKLVASIFHNLETLRMEPQCKALCKKFAETAPQIETAWNTFWLPFLRELAIAIQGLASANPMYQRYLWVLTTILTRYMDLYVGDKPAPFKDNYRPGYPTCKEHCSYCSMQLSFLQDSRKTLKEFLLSQDGLDHVMPKLRKADVGVSLEITQTQGITKRLMVRKVAVRQNMLDAWNQRLTLAHGELNKFNQQQLEALLGGKYHQWRAMHTSVCQPSASLHSLSRSQPAPPLPRTISASQPAFSYQPASTQPTPSRSYQAASAQRVQGLPLSPYAYGLTTPAVHRSSYQPPSTQATPPRASYNSQQRTPGPLSTQAPRPPLGATSGNSQHQPGTGLFRDEFTVKATDIPPRSDLYYQTPPRTQTPKPSYTAPGCRHHPIVAAAMQSAQQRTSKKRKAVDIIDLTGDD